MRVRLGDWAHEREGSAVCIEEEAIIKLYGHPLIPGCAAAEEFEEAGGAVDCRIVELQNPFEARH